MGASNPILCYLPLKDSLAGRDRSGTFSAVATGPVRYVEQGGEAGYWAEEGTTNLLTNPECANNATNWLAYGGSGARVTGLSIVHPTAGHTVTTGWRTNFANAVTNAGAFGVSGVYSAGQTISDSVLLLASDTAIGKTVQLRMRESGGAQPEATMGSSVQVVLTGDPQIVSLTRSVVETDRTAVNLLVTMVSTVSAGTDILVMTAGQHEGKAYPTSYAAGHIGPGYTWSGTAHASASVRAATNVSLSGAGRIDTLVGSWFVRSLILYESTASNQYAVNYGAYGTPNDFLSLVRRVLLPDKSSIWFRSAATDAEIRSAGTVTPLVWETSYGGWSGRSVSGAYDGGALSTGTRGTPTGVPQTNDTLFVGNSRGTGSHLNGLLHDLAIYDAPLSDARRALVNAAIDNGADLWGLLESPYVERVLATPGLVSYWRLGEPFGPTAIDVKSGNNGAYNGTPGYGATGLVAKSGDTAIQFSGDDTITFASSAPFVTGVFSFEAWIVIDAWVASMTLANIWNASFGAGWCLKLPDSSPTGRMNLFVEYTVSGPHDLFSTGWALATPYHIVATCDGQYQRLYRNGVKVAEAGPFSAAVKDSGSMAFGIGYMTPTGGFQWQGKVDEAAFYNVALSDAEIVAHYRAGAKAGNRFGQFQLRPTGA